jgi:ribose transport system substrate-binding protein
VKKKWILSIACLVFLAGILSYIFIARAQEKPTIDIILKNSDSDYWKIMRAGIVKAANNMGADEKIYIPERVDEDQVKILKKVLKEKPDAVIVALTNPDLAIPILQEYKKAKIPVLLVDTEADWPDQTSFIGTDNPTLGRKAGELLTSSLQPGDKAALFGQMSNNTVNTDRMEGAKNALNAAGIHVVAEKMISPKNDNTNEALSTIIKEYPDLKGIFAATDELALKIIKFSAQNGLKLQVVGSDGTIEMVDKIQDGTLMSTLSQNPYDIGYLSMENAVKACKGKSVENRINSGVDIVTKDNAKSKKEFIKKILNQD